MNKNSFGTGVRDIPTVRTQGQYFVPRTPYFLIQSLWNITVQKANAGTEQERERERERSRRLMERERENNNKEKIIRKFNFHVFFSFLERKWTYTQET